MSFGSDDFAAIVHDRVDGIVIAFLLWLIMALTSYYGGDSIFLASVGAREIQRHHHPTLFNIVEEMTIAGA